MEFPVEFKLDIPDSVPEPEIEDRLRAEAAAAETWRTRGYLSDCGGPPSELAQRRSLASIAPAAGRNSIDSWMLCRCTNGCIRPSRRSFSTRAIRRSVRGLE